MTEDQDLDLQIVELDREVAMEMMADDMLAEINHEDWCRELAARAVAYDLRVQMIAFEKELLNY